MLIDRLAKEGAIVGKGVPFEAVLEAEQLLGVTFSDEYRDYLCKYGVAAFNGHELTGISSSNRINVVDVTINVKDSNQKIPSDLYVIEQTNIDGIIIWQDRDGLVYASNDTDAPRVIAKSIEEFLMANAAD